MDFSAIFFSQITDPFRLGLLAVLLLTTRNTAAHTGIAIPILAGILFVAILIPLTFSPDAANWWTIAGVGLLSNGVIVAVFLAAYLAYSRLVSSSGRQQ